MRRRYLFCADRRPFCAGSISFLSFPFKELFAGHGVEEFFFPRSVKMNPHINRRQNSPHSRSVAFLPTVMMAAGFVVSVLFYLGRAVSCRSNSPTTSILFVNQSFLLTKW